MLFPVARPGDSWFGATTCPQHAHSTGRPVGCTHAPRGPPGCPGRPPPGPATPTRPGFLPPTPTPEPPQLQRETRGPTRRAGRRGGRRKPVPGTLPPRAGPARLRAISDMCLETSKGQKGGSFPLWTRSPRLPRRRRRREARRADPCLLKIASFRCGAPDPFVSASSLDVTRIFFFLLCHNLSASPKRTRAHQRACKCGPAGLLVNQALGSLPAVDVSFHAQRPSASASAGAAPEVLRDAPSWLPCSINHRLSAGAGSRGSGLANQSTGSPGPHDWSRDRLVTQL